MPEAESLTVMLPTFRRPGGLARVLRALAAQDDPGVEWDLVVIDNDDPPGSEDVFRMGSASVGVPARYFREARRGSAHARNRGIAEASGAVTVMLDDDVVPASDWLATVVEPILAGRCEGTGGKVLLDPAVPRPAWLGTGITGYLAEWNLGDAERELTGEREFIVTSNCAFRTDLLRTSGGFDPALGPSGTAHLVGDDYLLTRRFRAVGGRVRYVPRAIVVHDLPAERLRPGYLLRRAYAQGRSDWLLDRDELAARRFGGAKVAIEWLGIQLRRRARDGLGRRTVAFHAACDLVRTLGALRQAASLARARRAS